MGRSNAALTGSLADVRLRGVDAMIFDRVLHGPFSVTGLNDEACG